jgi:inner membrane protein involved in colicin E2 resistance
LNMARFLFSMMVERYFAVDFFSFFLFKYLWYTSAVPRQYVILHLASEILSLWFMLLLSLSLNFNRNRLI